MSYKAKHKQFCEDANRYVIYRKVKIIENRRGSILDNSDPGFVLSVKCESCGAPAEWKS